jgi:hypothetical protein
MRCLGIVTCILAIPLITLAQAPKEKRAPPPPVDQQEIQSLNNDISRMRTLVQQMEMNLAFVQTSQTPLKHQFELEIEMWRVMLGDMERRVQRLRGARTSGVVLPDTVPLRQNSRQGTP